MANTIKTKREKKENNKLIIVRKYELKVIGDKEEVNRVYSYIREGMKNQNLARNEYISALYYAELVGSTKDDKKELSRFYSRITHSKNETGYTDNIEFPTGIPTAATVQNRTKTDFENACKAGLMYGTISLPTYKMNSPLIIHPDVIRLRSTNIKIVKGKEKHINNGVYCDKYSTPMDLLKGLEKDANPEVRIKFANNIIFEFKFGNPWKGREQRKVFQRIFDETYKIRESSIGINKNNKIIINLCLEIPKQEHNSDEETCVGVDLGLSIPAMCALNNDEYKRLKIGDIEDFLRVRTQLQNQTNRLQRQLKNTSGGHGRTKKLQALDRIKDRERNFVQTYNHMVSRKVVDFALANNAKYINIEDLSGFGKDKNGNVKENKEIVLRNWSYYELQKYITDKAKRYGIEVRKVNPAYTSQICSYCGTKGIRKEQAKFICVNPDCKCHKIYNKEYFNADFNAARNIANSTDFVE